MYHRVSGTWLWLSTVFPRKDIHSINWKKTRYYAVQEFTKDCGKSWFPNGGALGIGAIPQPVDNSVHSSSPIRRGFMWSLVGHPLEDWQTETCGLFPGHFTTALNLGHHAWCLFVHMCHPWWLYSEYHCSVDWVKVIILLKTWPHLPGQWAFSFLF